MSAEVAQTATVETENDEPEHQCEFGDCEEFAATTATVDYGNCIVTVDRCHEHLKLTKKNHDVLDVDYWD